MEHILAWSFWRGEAARRYIILVNWKERGRKRKGKEGRKGKGRRRRKGKGMGRKGKRKGRKGRERGEREREKTGVKKIKS